MAIPRLRFGFVALWPTASTWMALVAGAFVAAVLIAWPAIARWAQAPEKNLVAVATVATQPMSRDKSDKPEPPPRRRAGRAESTSIAQSVRPRRLPTVQTDPPGPAESDGSREPFATQVEELTEQETEQETVLLSADDPPFDLGALSSGQTVRGDPQRRPVIDVPPGGIIIAADNITIENVDFVAGESFSAGDAMLTLHASHAVFDGCSFDGGESAAPQNLPVAMASTRDVGKPQRDSRELLLRNSSFQNVAAAVSCLVARTVRCHLENILHLGPGPLIAIDRPPEFGEAVAVTLSHVTVRAAQGVVAIGCEQLPGELGRLEVEDAESVFALPSAAALLVYHGAVRPGPLLAGMRWTGRGSVFSGRGRMAMWRMPEGRMLATRDDAAPITGVVRGEIAFAGSIEEGWDGSHVVHCEAPLDSSQRPGIQ